MVWTTMHWHHARLVIQEKKSPPINATVYKKALNQFNHKIQKKQHQPYPSSPIIYGTKKQYATPQSTAPLLDKKGKKFIQQVCGKFLFLGRLVDITLLCPISAIASQSATPTEDTMGQTQQLLDYISMQ